MKILKGNIFQLSIRIFIGIVFLLSAIFKLLSIDSFEIFVYSYQLFSLNFSYLLARFLISSEAVLGLMLILGISPKFTKYTSLGILAAFTVYLVLVLNQEDNCHCFGEFLEMTPKESIFKNIGLILMVLFVRTNHEFRYRFKKLILSTLIVVSFVLPLIVSPPDFIYTRIYSINTEVNEEEFAAFLTDQIDFPTDISQGKQMLCFYGPSCEFCKITAGKISILADKFKINKANISCVFFGNEEKIKDFFTISDSQEFEYSIINAGTFLQITEGRMPLVVLLNDGVIVEKFGSRNLNETFIRTFFEE